MPVRGLCRGHRAGRAGERAVARARGRRRRGRGRDLGDARGPRHDADRGPRRDRKLRGGDERACRRTRSSAAEASPSTSRWIRSRGRQSSPAVAYGAMAMVAVGDPGTLPRLPQMYVRKMAVGPGRPRVASIWPSPSPTTYEPSPTRSAGIRTTSPRSCSTGPAITICSRSFASRVSGSSSFRTAT